MTVTQIKPSADERQAMFFCVGNNHRTSNIATRESFYLSPEQITSVLATAARKFSIKELAILSTCNRCEVFGVLPQEFAKDHSSLKEIYAAVHEMAGNRQAAVYQTGNLSVYTLTGLDAVRHAFKVASSLDSLVPGETQITGQFKDAMALAKDSGTFGPMLDRLAQAALATAKNIRSNTEIGRHRVSISHAAVDLAKRASHDLSSLRFLIIGAGEMARVAAEYVATHKPKSLTIANRSRQKAFELTEHLGLGEHHGLENLAHLMARADVVISATTAPGYIIEKSMVESAIEGRADQPLFLIDIALPRDINPAAAEVADSYLFDIDDLKSVVDAHMEKRKDAVNVAMNILATGVESFAQWLSQREVAPIISNSSRYFTDVISREAAKTFSKDLFANLSEKQRQAIEGFVEAVSSRVTSDIAQSLKKASPEEARDLSLALQSVFNRDSRP